MKTNYKNRLEEYQKDLLNSKKDYEANIAHLTQKVKLYREAIAIERKQKRLNEAELKRVEKQLKEHERAD